jgi:hypothetical protein
MAARLRRLAGLALVLVGVAAAAVLLRLFLRVGFPRPQDGPRGMLYLWLLALGVGLPVTAGVAVARPRRSGRRFAGWWLLAVGALVIGTLWSFGPAYRDWLLWAAVGSVGCALPLMGGGVLLLLRAGRGGLRAPAGQPGPAAERAPRSTGPAAGGCPGDRCRSRRGG